jgi:hypothetical protein
MGVDLMLWMQVIIELLNDKVKETAAVWMQCNLVHWKFVLKALPQSKGLKSWPSNLCGSHFHTSFHYFIQAQQCERKSIL